MNENLINQMVVALLQDGTIKLTADELVAVLTPAVADLPVQFSFRGVVQPGIAPGSVLSPRLYVAVAGGTYPSFSGQSVNEGQIVFLYSTDGGYWTKAIAYDGVSPIPSGSKNYLTIEATQDSTAVSFFCTDISIAKAIEVSTDGETWTEKTASTSGTALATLDTGDKLYLRGENAAYADENEYWCYPFADKPCYVYGNIMSMIGGEDFEDLDSVGDYAFKSFLDDGNGGWIISKADEPILLPATTLGASCYAGMFTNQNLLTTAPELPATTLAVGCYASMFYHCTGLTAAPELPVTTLAMGCYGSMFYHCTGLTTAPELPATTLAEWCYFGMFSDCTGLATAPDLPATTLAEGCYQEMFSGCSALESVKCLATDLSATGATTDWLANVAASGTFTKAAGVNWSSGDSGIPTGWTTQEA